MWNNVFLALAVVYLCTTVQTANVVRFFMDEMKADEQTTFLDHSGIRHFFDSLKHPFFHQSKKATRLESFSWGNCGDPGKELMVLQSLSISPDPIHLPGSLTIGFAAVFNQTVDAPLQVDLKLEKEVFDVWIEVPCIDNIGSCTYDDVCQSLSKVTCPPQFVQQKVPCKCPFNKGSYKLSNATFSISASGVPSGSYRATANLSTKGAFVGCYNFQATLS